MGRRKHSRRKLSLDDIPPPPPPVEEVDWNTQTEEASAFSDAFGDKDELDVTMEGPYSPHRHQYQPQMQSRSLGVNREYNEVALTESDPKYSDNPEYSDKVIIEEEEEEQDCPSSAQLWHSLLPAFCTVIGIRHCYNRTHSLRHISRSKDNAAPPTNQRELSSAARTRDRRTGRNEALVLQRRRRRQCKRCQGFGKASFFQVAEWHDCHGLSCCCCSSDWPRSSLR
mmetsp:Transcript_2099/g.2711  ORF Transcript_2099/g.2711 Transcript_2099/m.2711 type:complete len:226 (+) Transcript_2099:126-803(+)